jgi:hypothetical protein
MKSDYIAAGTWPDDGVEVDENVFIEFRRTPPEGKVLGSDSNHFPCWVDAPPESEESIINRNSRKKESLLEDARKVIDPLQDAVDLDMATDEEKSKLRSWKKYRVLLNRVDISTAKEIEWPNIPH